MSFFVRSTDSIVGARTMSDGVTSPREPNMAAAARTGTMTW
jgi:hypothetical protein